MMVAYVSLFSTLLCGFVISAVTDEEFEQLKDLVTRVQKTQKNVITSLARQVSQQQLYVEEMTRSYGDSGLKLIRLSRSGSKPYWSTSYSDNRVAAIHTHSNYRGTVGMGEFVAVLNGVEFRTRHNDYKMRMPSHNSTEYGATEDIPYPEVPPQVLAQPTVELQIEEMRKWFKAWKNSDYSKRDYRKYFKPNLCYLEGQWTNAKDGVIDEPFFSERHSIDAESFFDLQSKIRYTSMTGRKSTKENYAYLPTTISEVDEHGNIAYAQWNYQILCHPLKNFDVPLTRFELEDDLGVRVASGKNMEDFANQRAARFSLHKDPGASYADSKDTFTKVARGTYLDQLMAEIPGKDNYPSNIVDDLFGEVAYSRDADLPKSPKANTTLPEPLNAGFYHNVYKVIGKDAMGVSIRRRGFSDNNLYLAYNTRPKVTQIKVKAKCKKQKACINTRNATCAPARCPVSAHRVSYAIPLEIIYTTPLQTWNPYNLRYFYDKKAPAMTNAEGGKRNGGDTADTAYLGISTRYYSMTPIDFFESGDFVKDAADTTKKEEVGVLDREGVVRQVTASGISIMTRSIPGVGPMRIRFPIMPLHDTGSTIYKDVKALADMTLKKEQYLNLYPDSKLDNGTIDEVFTFVTSLSTSAPPSPHMHTVELTQSDIDTMKSGNKVKTTTSESAGHNHELVLKWVERKKSIRIFTCDNDGNECWDGHKGLITCPDCEF